MSKYDDKVIPTLDDVIRPGVLDETEIGDLSAFDDDQDDTHISLNSNAELDDDHFEDDFEKIFLDTESPQNRATPDDISIDVFEAEIDAAIDKEAPTKSLDFNDSIADFIVAERFPEKEATKNTSASTAAKPPPARQKASPAKAANKPVKQATPAPVQSPAAATEITISKVVDEITRKLMPEIEWKIRTLVRDSLEQHFADKD